VSGETCHILISQKKKGENNREKKGQRQAFCHRVIGTGRRNGQPRVTGLLEWRHSSLDEVSMLGPAIRTAKQGEEEGLERTNTKIGIRVNREPRRLKRSLFLKVGGVSPSQKRLS